MSISQTIALVGIDFDDSGDDAILAALAWQVGDSRRILHALHVLDADDIKDRGAKPALLAQAEALARVPVAVAGWIAQLAAERGLLYEPARIHVHARIGSAAPTLLQMAVDYEAELLIVGTHARRGLDRMLLGSVAEKLVRGARCPVLVARPKNYTGTRKTKLPDPPRAPGHTPPDYQGLHEPPSSIQTESDIWQATPGRPTGFRIV